MRNFLKNCRDAFSEEEYGKDDSGAMINTVFTVFFVGAFAVISILAISWIGNAILWNAQTPAQCLADSNNINGNRATNPDLVCIGATNEKAAEGSAIIKNQIQNSKGNRF